MVYPAKKEGDSYTYGDYLTWPTDQRWELLQGTAYNMSPAPARIHQRLVVKLSYQFERYLQAKGSGCEVYVAPFDVRLPRAQEHDADITTVVQPDIAIICDQAKLDDKGCKGAPDLVVEIVSPSSAALDYIKKTRLYEQHRVKEYWIVHPFDQIVMVYKLNADLRYGRPDIYADEDIVGVGIFADNLQIKLNEIFTQDRNIAGPIGSISELP
jgi:Uma2 family endonuclease